MEKEKAESGGPGSGSLSPGPNPYDVMHLAGPLFSHRAENEGVGVNEQ